LLNIFVRFVRVHRVYINDKIEGTSLNKHTLKAAAGEA
jgi:hypothetical protein